MTENNLGKGENVIKSCLRDAIKEADKLYEENKELKTTNIFLEEENGQIHKELKTRTALQHKLEEENERLKQRINSRLHFYRELYETTNNYIVKRVIEDLEDVLR